MSDSSLHPDRSESPAGLYVHIPFCVAKCGYCSFASYPCGGAPPAGYLDAVRQEAETLARHPLVRGRAFATLFVGGGTPTIYGGEELAGMIRHCRGLFDLAPDAEVTVEANPNTVDEAKLADLRRAGVNRLSIGVQAFSDRLLGQIERRHTVAQALAAVRAARAAGFANVNLDLIYGLPTQGIDDWRETLAQALDLSPEHLALYALSVEEGTPFSRREARGELALPDEETLLAMEESAYLALAGAGYERYEISNFARSGLRSRHNGNYWRNGAYLGLGAAAVSCLDHLRFRAVAEPDRFAALVAEGRQPWLDLEGLSPAAAFRETVIMGLRLLAGIAVDELEARFGVTPQAYYGSVLDRLMDQGLVAITDGRLYLTPRALPVANQVLAELV